MAAGRSSTVGGASAGGVLAAGGKHHDFAAGQETFAEAAADVVNLVTELGAEPRLLVRENRVPARGSLAIRCLCPEQWSRGIRIWRGQQQLE